MQTQSHKTDYGKSEAGTVKYRGGRKQLLGRQRYEKSEHAKMLDEDLEIQSHE